MPNFKHRYIKNEVEIEDLDKFVDLWHQNQPNICLQEYLGFSDEDYTAFAHSESALKKKLDALKKFPIARKRS